MSVVTIADEHDMDPSEPPLSPPAPFAPPSPAAVQTSPSPAPPTSPSHPSNLSQPPPTLPVPPAQPTPPPPAQPIAPSQPVAPLGSPASATPTVVPVIEARSSKPRFRSGVLIGALSILTVAVVAIGAFALLSDVPEETLTDDAAELATETPDRSAGFSYGAASANAQLAASISFEMSIDADEGAQFIEARVDRATGRISMDIDISEFDQGDAAFVVGDSIGMIIDEQTNTVYLTSNIFGGFLGEDDGWLQLDANEFDDDSTGFDQMFTNPLAITDVLGELEPVDLGLETVGDELLRHFRVTVDAATLAGISGADANVFGDDIIGAVDVTYDVWVSEDDQVRRITFVADDPDSQEQASVTMNITTSPEPIEIEIPDDVVDLDELFGEMGTVIED